MQSISARLAAGPPILIDGGMGTELERIGAPMDGEAWCGVAVATSPDKVREVHVSFIQAGAEVQIVNTYASAPHALAWAGQEDKAQSINRDAVRLAREAIDEAAPAHPVWVAGSLSTFNGPNRERVTDTALESSWRRQAQWLVDAGCDLLILEMMLVNRHMSTMAMQHKLLDIAHETGLPVWYGLSCTSPDGKTVMPYNLATAPEENGPDQVGKLIASLDFDKMEAIGVMHSNVPAIAPALDLLKQHTSLPRLAYPNSGYFTMPNWQFTDIIPPSEFAGVAQQWLDQGTRIIGGCCGLGPEHIRVLADLIAARSSATMGA